MPAHSVWWFCPLSPGDSLPTTTKGTLLNSSETQLPQKIGIIICVHLPYGILCKPKMGRSINIPWIIDQTLHICAILVKSTCVSYNGLWSILFSASSIYFFQNIPNCWYGFFPEGFWIHGACFWKWGYVWRELQDCQFFNDSVLAPREQQTLLQSQ